MQTQHPEKGQPGPRAHLDRCWPPQLGVRALNAIPIPEDTKEADHSQVASSSLVETYGSLFEIVTCPAAGFRRNANTAGLARRSAPSAAIPKDTPQRVAPDAKRFVTRADRAGSRVAGGQP